MMNMKQLVMAGTAIVMCLGAADVLAQNNDDSNGKKGPGRPGRGGPPDPAQAQQWQQQRVERYKDRLEITDDTEWKAIQPLIEKITDLQRQSFADRVRGEFGRGGRGGGDSSSGDQGGRRGFRGGFGGEPSKEAEALQKAIDGKAPKAELKEALAKYVESRKDKQTDLEKAQADLRKVLSVRQEAIASLAGLL